MLKNYPPPHGATGQQGGHSSHTSTSAERLCLPRPRLDGGSRLRGRPQLEPNFLGHVAKRTEAGQHSEKPKAHAHTSTLQVSPPGECPAFPSFQPHLICLRKQARNGQGCRTGSLPTAADRTHMVATEGQSGRSSNPRRAGEFQQAAQVRQRLALHTL